MEYQFGLFIAEVICISFGYFGISRPAHGRLNVSLNETNSSDYGTYLMFDTKEGEAGEEDLRRVEDHVEQIISSDYFLMKVQTI